MSSEDSSAVITGQITCKQCGELNLPDANFCTSCGVKINGHMTPISSHHRKKNILLLIPLILAAMIALSWFVIDEIGKNTLAKSIQKDWKRVEEGNSSPYLLELKIDDDEIEYNFISGYALLDRTIGTYKYTIIGPDSINADGRVLRVEFNDDKTMMTLRPAITSIDSFEIWYDLD